MTVKLVFEKFDVERLDPVPGCPQDYVEVFDGSDSSSTISKGRFCGPLTPENITSSGRYMWVRFRADMTNSYFDGFKATFSAEGGKWKS